MTWRVIVGSVSMVVTMILLGYVAVTEQDRMASFTTSYESRQVEAGAAIFETNCTRCHGPEGKGIEGVAPSLNAPDLFDGARLKEIGWAGATADYLRSAIAGGRPRPSADFANYPERMPTWGEQFGGPLRTDQVNALVAFIMNWGVGISAAPAAPPVEGVGADITLQLPPGNADNGKAITEGKGCVGCHVKATPDATLVGPAWLAKDDPSGEGIGARAGHRFSDADYAGKGKAASAEQYLFESIVQPGAYLVPGDYKNPDGNSKMPAIYPNTLTKQDVADIVAYLLTLR